MRITDRQAGQAILELAIVMPLLLLMLMGTLVLGLSVQTKMVVVNAAKEGSRLGSIGGTNAEIRYRVEEVLVDGGLKIEGRFLRDSDVTINRAGGDVEVIVWYRQPTIIPGIHAGSMTIRGVAVFR